MASRNKEASQLQLHLQTPTHKLIALYSRQQPLHLQTPMMSRLARARLGGHHGVSAREQSRQRAALDLCGRTGGKHRGFLSGTGGGGSCCADGGRRRAAARRWLGLSEAGGRKGGRSHGEGRLSVGPCYRGGGRLDSRAARAHSPVGKRKPSLAARSASLQHAVAAGQTPCLEAPRRIHARLASGAEPLPTASCAANDATRQGCMPKERFYESLAPCPAPPLGKSGGRPIDARGS